MNASIVYGLISLLLIAIVFLSSVFFYPWFHHTLFPALSEAEIQMYVSAIGLTTVLLSLWYWLSWRLLPSQKKVFRYPHIPSPLILVISIGSLFMFVFGTYIFPNTTFQGRIAQMGVHIAHTFDYSLYILITLAWFLILATIEIPPPFSKKIYRNPIFRLIFGLVVVISIIGLSFHVGYLSIFDHASYAGPIHNVLHGIPLLTFFSWYGFLSIAFLSALYAVIPLSLLSMTIVTGLAVTIGFLVLLGLGIIVYRHVGISSIAILSLILSNWIVQTGLRNTLPENTVLRFGIWIPLAFLIYLDCRGSKHKTLLRLLVEITLAIGFFWTFDIGMYLLISYLLFRWLLSLRSNPYHTIIIFIKTISPTVLVLLGVFSIINLFYVGVLHVYPQWHFFTDGPIKFLGTFLMIPLPQSAIPWLVVSPPVLCLVILSSKHRFTSLTPREKLLVFIASYAVVQFAYVMGRSSLGTLRTVLPPIVLCLFWIVHESIRFSKRFSAKMTIAVIILFSYVLAYPTYIDGLQSIQNLRQENILTTIHTLGHPSGTEEEFFGPTVREITRRYGGYIRTNGIALVSAYDIWYLVLVGQTNRTGSNCLFCFLTPQMVAPFTQTIQDKKFHYLFVDTDQTLHMGQVSWIMGPVKNHYTYKETVGLLSVFERKD